MNDLEHLRQRFNRHFEHWGIELPTGVMMLGEVWLLVECGWTIWTRFDQSEDGYKYLDYYAMHRMTNDCHLRLYSDGSEEDLPAICDHYIYPSEASKEEKDSARAEFYEYNQRVQQLLDEKGFVMTDAAHGSARINRWLLTNPTVSKQTEN